MNRSTTSLNNRRRPPPFMNTSGRVSSHHRNSLKYVLLPIFTFFLILLFYFNLQLARQAFSYEKSPSSPRADSNNSNNNNNNIETIHIDKVNPDGGLSITQGMQKKGDESIRSKEEEEQEEKEEEEQEEKEEEEEEREEKHEEDETEEKEIEEKQEKGEEDEEEKEEKQEEEQQQQEREENEEKQEVQEKEEEEEVEEEEHIENSNDKEVDSVIDKYKETTRHVIFILIGAVRAIEKTALITLQNLVGPLCSPSNCTAHLVTHLSYSDNRPDERMHDPKGISITLEEATIQRIHSFIQNKLCSFTERMQHEETSKVHFKDCHEVSPAYDIGSTEEQTVMDSFENECCNQDPVQRNRLRSLRYGDPRRYSMWFARNYAWRYVESTLLSSTNSWNLNPNNTQFMFIRPDLLWYLPFAPFEYIHAKTTSDHELWIHDSYYANIPDTWAFLPNANVARGYFSLLDILQDGVGCLGGPDFDRSLAEERLKNMALLNSSETAGENMVLKWCTDNDPSWSEEILLAKLRRLNIQHRFLPAGVSLIRKEWIDCQPIHPHFKLDDETIHVKTYIPVLKCFMTSTHFFHEQGETLLEIINSIDIFRIRGTANHTVCITQLSDNGTLGMDACKEHPILQSQLFASSSYLNGLFSLWDRFHYQNVSSFTSMLEPWTAWSKEIIQPFDQVKSLELHRER